MPPADVTRHFCAVTNRRAFLPLCKRGNGSGLEVVMQGVITSRDVFRHAFTIVHLWGPGFLARCLIALARHRPTTFLDVLCAAQRDH